MGPKEKKIFSGYWACLVQKKPLFCGKRKRGGPGGGVGRRAGDRLAPLLIVSVLFPVLYFSSIKGKLLGWSEQLWGGRERRAIKKRNSLTMSIHPSAEGQA